MTWLLIAAVIVGVTLGDVGFYLGTGTTPGSAWGKPMWSSLGLGAFGIAIALKERGAARWAFFGWALHQGLIALTPVGDGGWQPWVIRNVILLFSATLLIVAARDEERGLNGTSAHCGVDLGEYASSRRGPNHRRGF